MSNPENFLARWSRRKHAAALESEEAISPAAPSPASLEEAARTERSSETECLDDRGILPGTGLDPAAPPFDPLSVPPIESITADTDIRGFLAPGVPPDLARAALRRAWAADPKVRDFVGLADYDWDFNTPGSMAGFGSLEMTDDLCRAAAQIIGRAPSPGEPDMIEPDMMAQPQQVRHQVENTELAKNARIAASISSGEADDFKHRDQESGSTPPQARMPESSQLSIVRQSHGGALPK
jgi:hypothetical protein